MHINAHEDLVVPPQYTTLCSEVTSEEKWPRLYSAIIEPFHGITLQRSKGKLAPSHTTNLNQQSNFTFLQTQ